MSENMEEKILQPEEDAVKAEQETQTGTQSPLEETSDAQEGAGSCEETSTQEPEETAGGIEEEDPADGTKDESGDDPEEEPEDSEDVMDGEWTPAEGEEKDSGIKGFFKKNRKDKKDAQIEELTDRVRRQMAEFDNFRKRTEKEKAAMYEVGARSVIEKILPVVDNFERGLAAAGDTEDPFVDGMQKTYKQLMTTLESLGVKPIEAVGQEFNPDFHNAVMHVEDDSVGENIVIEELQKGYMYRDSVVRYSMVKVAN